MVAMTSRLASLMIASSISVACTDSHGKSREFAVSGQVIAVERSVQEITIAHDPIVGYMDAMTMPFSTGPHVDVARFAPGDLVRGTLVVTDEDAFLERVERTGRRTLEPQAREALGSGGDDLLLEGDTVPHAAFVDHEGRAHRLGEPNSGRTTVVTFIYTRCPLPTFCPLLDRQFRALQQTIRQDSRLAEQVRLMSITIDPEFDTRQVLFDHAMRVGADASVWTFVRPDGTEADRLPMRFGLGAERDSRNPAFITHRLATVVIDRHGVIVKILRGNNWRPRQVIDLITGSASSTQGL
jgi:protein SCO1/2